MSGQFAAVKHSRNKSQAPTDLDTEIPLVSEASRQVHERACDTARRLIQARYGNGTEVCTDTLQMLGLTS